MSDLERALVALGRDLDLPEMPDVVPAVLVRLERPSRRPRRRPRWALAIALAALAAVAATLAVPEARSALFRVLHIGGERIEFVDELPAVPAGRDLGALLGERVSLEEARRRAGFDVRELEETPDRVYLGTRRTIWFLYGTPEQVSLLVAQTPRLAVDEGLILKKLAGPGTQVDEVSVRGRQGFFIGGEPHVVLLLDDTGNPVEENAWLARNVLVWEDEGIAVRLEGDFTKDEALELAESLR